MDWMDFLNEIIGKNKVILFFERKNRLWYDTCAKNKTKKKQFDTVTNMGGRSLIIYNNQNWYFREKNFDNLKYV